MKSYELDKYVKDYMSGIEHAFDIIYNETKTCVYLSIYPIIKSQDKIEDLMQDVYMKVIDNLSYYELGTNFKAWISKIAHNIAINEYNKNKNISSLDEMELELEDYNNPNDNTLLYSALKILKGKEREVIIYHIVLDMKFKDIANILEIPKSTVHDLYKRAINTIKEKL